MNLNDLPSLAELEAEMLEREKARIEADKIKLSASYFEFFKQAVQVLEPETDWSFNWHIQLVCDLIQEEVFRIHNKEKKEFDLVINVPPGSSKSKIFSVCLTGWAWIHAPYLKIGTMSFNQTLSNDHCMQARRLIASRWYQERFGDRYQLSPDENTKSVFSNTRGGERRSGVQTGKHFDIVIADDPLDPKLASSEAARKTADKIFFKVIPSRFKNPKVGLKIVVMQRLHEDDICGVIKQKKLKYKHVVIPAELSEAVTPVELATNYSDNLFWPDRFTQEDLKEKKAELGSREYAGQYSQSPYPEDGDVWKKEWFSKRFKPSELPVDITRHFYTDSAFGVQGGDHSASICWSVYSGNMYIWDVLVTKNKKITKWKTRYKEFVESNGGNEKSRHYVENKASGYDIEDSLLEETDFNMIMDKISNQLSKFARAEAAAPKAEAGRVYLLEGANFIEEFVAELIKYPNGSFDDQVDILSGAIRKTDWSVQSKKIEGEKEESLSF